MSRFESGRQLDVGKPLAVPLTVAVLQLLLQLFNSQPRLDGRRAGDSAPHGLRAGLGGILCAGVMFKHAHIIGRSGTVHRLPGGEEESIHINGFDNTKHPRRCLRSQAQVYSMNKSKQTRA